MKFKSKNAVTWNWTSSPNQMRKAAFGFASDVLKRSFLVRQTSVSGCREIRGTSY